MNALTTLPANVSQFLESLPSEPSPECSDKYVFLDTRKVVEDMADLGYTLVDGRRAAARSRSGLYGVHELDFRRPQDLGKSTTEAPRILFFNSYDGSKKAQFLSGLIRFACSNGMVFGDFMENEKFIHINSYEDELLAAVRCLAEGFGEKFDFIDRTKEIELAPDVYLQMADKALETRFTANELRVDAHDILAPRRESDTGSDLWTKFNVIQENIIRGGMYGEAPTDGKIRVAGPVTNIERSTRLNAALWSTLEEFAELA